MKTQRVLLAISLGLSFAFSSNVDKLKASDAILAQTSSGAESLTVKILKNSPTSFPAMGRLR